jgi:hypothetical protein
VWPWQRKRLKPAWPMADMRSIVVGSVRALQAQRKGLKEDARHAWGRMAAVERELSALQAVIAEMQDREMRTCACPVCRSPVDMAALPPPFLDLVRAREAEALKGGGGGNRSLGGDLPSADEMRQSLAALPEDVRAYLADLRLRMTRELEERALRAAQPPPPPPSPACEEARTPPPGLGGGPERLTEGEGDGGGEEGEAPGNDDGDEGGPSASRRGRGRRRRHRGPRGPREAGGGEGETKGEPSTATAATATSQTTAAEASAAPLGAVEGAVGRGPPPRKSSSSRGNRGRGRGRGQQGTGGEWRCKRGKRPEGEAKAGGDVS